MPGNSQAAVLRRADPDWAKQRIERPADRHAARLGVLGCVSVAAAAPLSLGPAGSVEKACVVRGHDSRATFRRAPAGPPVLHVLAALTA